MSKEKEDYHQSSLTKTDEPFSYGYYDANKPWCVDNVAELDAIVDEASLTAEQLHNVKKLNRRAVRRSRHEFSRDRGCIDYCGATFHVSSNPAANRGRKPRHKDHRK